MFLQIKMYKKKLYCSSISIYFFKQPPFIIKDSDSSRGYKGYCIELINEIAKKVGFDYEIKEVEDGKFGSLNEKVRMSNDLVVAFTRLSSVLKGKIIFYRVNGME